MHKIERPNLDSVKRNNVRRKLIFRQQIMCLNHQSYHHPLIDSFHDFRVAYSVVTRPTSSMQIVIIVQTMTSHVQDDDVFPGLYKSPRTSRTRHVVWVICCTTCVTNSQEIFFSTKETIDQRCPSSRRYIPNYIVRPIMYYLTDDSRPRFIFYSRYIKEHWSTNVLRSHIDLVNFLSQRNENSECDFRRVRSSVFVPFIARHYSKRKACGHYDDPVVAFARYIDLPTTKERKRGAALINTLYAANIRSRESAKSSTQIGFSTPNRTLSTCFCQRYTRE